MSAFRLGINMAGAVSAGSYTAGVLDFLTEALDEWEAAKQRGDSVPRHDISLEVFSGASAGGMCAAIASVMLQSKFDHIHDTSKVGTTNTFYESWVNKIDITELLKTQDLQQGGPVYSLLDCTIIDEIAKFALVPGAVIPRKYVSPHLTLFLTLTNLAGTPYSLNDVSSGSLEESALYHADRLRFETVQPGQVATDRTAKPLPLGRSGEGAWPLLADAAKATGAFPIFLRPRQIGRDKIDYDRPMWESVNPAIVGAPAVNPAWPAGIGDTIPTINVDGGVIDNDPFTLAHDYLASLDPASLDNQNPREPLKAGRAVITVAPFPSQDAFVAPKLENDATVMAAIGKLISVFISQSRFFGESLALITAGTSSRFVVAPSDDSIPPGKPALQGASLAAFGGFFDRSLRAHDFQLGRRNCQQFLRKHFLLPAGNPIIASGLSALGDKKGEALTRFAVDPPPEAATERNSRWIPVIPLCSDLVVQDVTTPVPGKISRERIDDIVDLIEQRLRKLAPILLKDVPSPLRILLQGVADLVELVGRDKIRDFLIAQLGDCME
jgi:predicted acylesterase/phospholipase RssA